MEIECLRDDEKWRNKMIGKLDYNNKDQALEIVNRFKEKYLHGNIKELQDFSFWNILTDEEFNGVSLDGNKFDGDRTRIVYAIDYLLYSHSEKEIPEFSLGNEGNYSGDTINTEVFKSTSTSPSSGSIMYVVYSPLVR
jgi:hypothetical protein